MTLRAKSKYMGPRSEAAKELVEALGLKGKAVRSLTLRMATDEVVTVTVEMTQSDVKAGKFTSVFKDYVLVSKDEIKEAAVTLNIDARGAADPEALARLLNPPKMILNPPPGPLNRYIMNGCLETCSSCGSSMMPRRWWLFGQSPGCIHPECKNYGERA